MAVRQHVRDRRRAGRRSSSPERIELDLAGVEFIDSSGLRSIVLLRNRARLEDIDLVRHRPLAGGASGSSS